MTETQPCIARFRTVSFGSASNNAEAAISICNIPEVGASSTGRLPIGVNTRHFGVSRSLHMYMVAAREPQSGHG
jgi:hypothetical protein